MARSRKEVVVETPAKDVPPAPPAKASKNAQLYIKYYLVAYNVLSTIGWAYILGLTVVHLFNIDKKSASVVSVAPTASSTLSKFIPGFLKSAPKAILTSSFESKLPALLRPFYRRSTTTFGRIGPSLALVQSAAVLEIVHVLLGWVRSPLQTTAIQVFSRFYLVWGIVELFPEVRTNPFYTSMVLSWSLTEVIRYPFYASNLLGVEPYALLYARYTAFYVLYPLGVFSEVALIYATLPNSWPWSSKLFGGKWRAGDYLRASLIGVWLPGLYFLYTYMMAQRAKVLGTSFLPKSKVN